MGREKGYCETPAGRLELRIRTSQWLVKVRDVWRQLHHHEPALLADYQRAILGTPLGANAAKMTAVTRRAVKQVGGFENTEAGLRPRLVGRTS